MLSNGRTLSYEYDAEERITKVTDSVDGVTEYTYDALGQLLTETKNGTVVNSMVYDNYGNIVSKNGKTYTYDSTWKDLLISCDGQSITYDAQGNPTSYLGHTLTWEKGRQLKSFDNTQYTYNANGIRTSKTVNGFVHTFVLDGTKILKESWNGNTIIPMYDNEDCVCGIICNDVPYYFFKNLQGDVIAIVNKDAETVAKYTYDAWGVCTIESDISASNIASVNPFRYRGYYYDSEIGMYYLQTRYYNPAVGRFVNADESAILFLSNTKQNTFDLNLFMYCSNDPIILIDKTGYVGEAAVVVFTIKYGTGLSGWWLSLKLGAFLLSVFPYLIWALALILTVYALHRWSLKADAEYAKRHIPNKLKLKDGRVDLSKFTNRNGPRGPKGGRGILGPLGYYIVKDLDQHKGSVWKLFNAIGERIASLASDGTIVGK